MWESKEIPKVRKYRDNSHVIGSRIIPLHLIDNLQQKEKITMWFKKKKKPKQITFCYCDCGNE